MKRCGACGVDKPLTDFYTNRKRPMSECKKCHTERGRVNRQKRRAADPEGYVIKTLREHRLRAYGMAPDALSAMLQAQGGSCAICSLVLTERSANVDHCHATNRVRGLLCKECNIGLGRFQDNPTYLDRAAAYVRGTQP